MSEEEIKIIDYFKEVINWYRKNSPDRVYVLNNKDIKIIQRLLDLYIRAKERNKDLNFENQSLFESIDCNDDNMLARRYQSNKIEIKKLKEENKILKDVFNQIRDLTRHYIVWKDYNTKNYNLKGCSKQEIYKNFARIREIVYAHYCNMNNDEALKSLINDKLRRK